MGIGDFARRAAYAIKYRELNILLSDTRERRSRGSWTTARRASGSNGSRRG